MEKYPMINPIRGKIFDDDLMVDIRNFEFETLQEHKFIDHYGVERTIDDFHHIILYREALKDIIKNVQENAYKEGYEAGLKEKRKIKTKNVKKEND